MTLPRVILALALLLAILPWGGRWVAAFDSLGLLAPYVAAALLLWAIFGRGRTRPARGLMLAGALIAALPVLRAALPTDAPVGPTIALLQHNIHYSNEGTDLPGQILGYDLATLQEVHSAQRAFADLPPDWAEATCPRPREVSTAVLSRLPVIESGCLGAGEAWARVQTPNGPLTVVSLHLYWPWPRNNDRQFLQVGRLAYEIARLPGPVLVAGDFNQTPWSAAVARIAEAAEGRPIGGLRTSFTLLGGLVRLPIDHVILPEGWGGRASAADRLNSDHNAIAVVLGEAAQ